MLIDPQDGKLLRGDQEKGQSRPDLITGLEQADRSNSQEQLQKSVALPSSPARAINSGRRTLTKKADLGSDVDGILDVALEIAAKRCECIDRLRQAVEANNVQEIVYIAKELCGYEQASN